MKRPHWLTKEVIGWTAFDFANQAFTMVIITAIWQQYFIKQVVPMEGGSDSRGKLRYFFEVDRHFVTIAALKSLADQGELKAKQVADAMKKYGVDPEKPDPARA